jgi:hypothetical protein
MVGLEEVGRGGGMSMRQWLRAVIGPSVDHYTEEYVVIRFNHIKWFYGEQILRRWTPPISEVIAA